MHQPMPRFPTELHNAAAMAVADYLSRDERVEAVLLTASCARGCAVAESCVDIYGLCSPEQMGSVWRELEPQTEEFVRRSPACRELAAIVPWSAVDVGFTDGHFRPGRHDFTSGPDSFEVEIGNLVAYAIPLSERTARFQELRTKWLPYYDEGLRAQRLEDALAFMHNNLDHVAPYARRGLALAAFDRLQLAFREFLQALFIHRRVYPVEYMKWVEQQVTELLNMPQLVPALHSVLSIGCMEAGQLAHRAELLRSLAAEQIEGTRS